MTNRQKMLGVTEYGYERGIKQDEWLADNEAFLAKAATLKKGEYRGFDVLVMWNSELFAICKFREVVPFFLGLAAAHPEHFSYTCTNDLDTLIVK